METTDDSVVLSYQWCIALLLMSMQDGLLS